MTYTLLNSNTASSRIPGVLELVLKPRETEKVPVQSSVERMGIEFGVLSDMQVSEQLFCTPNLTLGFDASTQEGVHFNVIHINTKEEYYMLDLAELPGGTHEDYCSQVCKLFERLAQTYCVLHDTPEYEQVLQTMQKNIACTITDRASVNLKTVKLLEEKWGTDITVAYCHLHPLETLSRNALSCLKRFEITAYDKLYSGTSVADKLLLAIGKMRYSDGSGDPKGFVSYLEKSCLGTGLFVRTRGNRLHVKLKNAETCVRYYAELLTYFEESCLRHTAFKDAIVAALKDDVAVQELRALAIYSIILSRPWMKRFYVKHGGELTHMGAFRDVRMVIENLKSYIEQGDCFSVNEITCDLFGNAILTNIQGEPVVDGDIWLSGQHLEHVSKMVLAIFEGTLLDLQRQYSDYLSLSEEALAERESSTTSTPLHNIAAEQEVGMVSAAQKRAPGATMLYMGSHIKATRNKTLKYLNSLPEDERRRRVALAISLGRSAKLKGVSARRDVKEEIVKRVATKQKEVVRKETISAQRDKVKNRKLLEEKITEAAARDVEHIMGEFDCCSETATTLQDIMKGQITGRSLVHGWFDKRDATIVPWYGYVVSKARKNYLIEYREICEDDDEEPTVTPMTPTELAADYISGDLQFL